MTRSENVGAVTHFMRNAWEPIAIPRWAISLKYAIFTAAGYSTFFSGIQTLDLSTPQGYVPVWAAFIMAGALLGFIGSLRPIWGWVEAIGASILFVFLAVLVFLVFARGATGGGFLLSLVTIIPGVRAFFLVTRIALSVARRETWRL